MSRLAHQVAQDDGDLPDMERPDLALPPLLRPNVFPPEVRREPFSLEPPAANSEWPERDARRWARGLAEAQSYRLAFGHLDVDRWHVTETGFRLGAWIRNRRNELKLQRLDPVLQAQLDELGMIWAPPARLWHQGLEEAREFRRLHGHLVPTVLYVSPTGFRLGAWLGKRRQELRRGRLHAHRKAVLDELGMVWVTPRGDTWDRGLREAQHFHKTNGHLEVPPGYVSNSGFKLGSWIKCRRREDILGRLSRDRKAMLDAIGMIWRAGARQQWRKGLREAREFAHRHGHLQPATEYVTESGFRLWAWLSNRRGDLKAGRLDPARKAELDALGMTWGASLSDKWLHGLSEARSFHQAHGHLDVRTDHITPSGFRLGRWITARRCDYKAGRLSPDRIAELERLCIAWDVYDDRWSAGIEHARAFHARNGHLRVPRDFITPCGFKLGLWLEARRLYLKTGRGRLSDARIRELDALGMVWSARS